MDCVLIMLLFFNQVFKLVSKDTVTVKKKGTQRTGRQIPTKISQLCRRVYFKPYHAHNPGTQVGTKVLPAFTTLFKGYFNKRLHIYTFNNCLIKDFFIDVD